MSDTLLSLRRALEADSIIAVAPIVLMTRPVGIAWALLVPGRRPLIEVRWFVDQRRGVLAPQIARLERLAREAARDTDLSIRIETTDERRAYGADLRVALDLQDGAELLIEAGLLDLPGSSLASLNGGSARPVGREAFDSAIGRLAASIAAWFGQVAPAARSLLQSTGPAPSGAE